MSKRIELTVAAATGTHLTTWFDMILTDVLKKAVSESVDVSGKFMDIPTWEVGSIYSLGVESFDTIIAGLLREPNTSELLAMVELCSPACITHMLHTEFSGARSGIKQRTGGDCILNLSHDTTLENKPGVFPMLVPELRELLHRFDDSTVTRDIVSVRGGLLFAIAKWHGVSQCTVEGNVLLATVVKQISEQPRYHGFEVVYFVDGVRICG